MLKFWLKITLPREEGQKKPLEKYNWSKQAGYETRAYGARLVWRGAFCMHDAVLNFF